MSKYRVKPGQKINLDEWDPDEKSEWSESKKEAKEQFLEINKELESLQELLYAENKHKILIVLQAMDTGGKDGVIRAVFDGVNPAGVRVASFKVPTEQELSHDFLWRIHKQTPGKGEMVIFNRSHYEDVLVVRVHNLVPRKVWEKRFEHINNFEKLLTDEGTTIIKFFLHIYPRAYMNFSAYSLQSSLAGPATFAKARTGREKKKPPRGGNGYLANN